MEVGKSFMYALQRGRIEAFMYALQWGRMGVFIYAW
jgi:hypothetical protein